MKNDILFCDYYKSWMETYKQGAVRDATYKKYQSAHNWLTKLVPDLKLNDLDRIKY